MTRVLTTHRRTVRQKLHQHKAAFIRSRPKMYNRMTAARRWDALFTEHGEAILGKNLASAWKWVGL